MIPEAAVEAAAKGKPRSRYLSKKIGPDVSASGPTKLLIPHEKFRGVAVSFLRQRNSSTTSSARPAKGLYRQPRGGEMNITEFLEARIAEDEKLAEEASVSMHGKRHAEAWDYASYVLSSERDATQAQDRFITEWWPTRILDECAAKRAILAVHNDRDGDCEQCSDYAWFAVLDGPMDHEEFPCPTIRALAAVYADHSDYQQEWAK